MNLSIFVREYKKAVLIQNKNNENPSQKLILLSGNMFDYIVRLLVWAVEGGIRYRYTLYSKGQVYARKKP